LGKWIYNKCDFIFLFYIIIETRNIRSRCYSKCCRCECASCGSYGWVQIDCLPQ